MVSNWLFVVYEKLEAWKECVKVFIHLGVGFLSCSPHNGIVQKGQVHSVFGFSLVNSIYCAVVYKKKPAWNRRRSEPLHIP